MGVLLSAAAALPGCVENTAPPSGASVEPPPAPPPLKTEPIGVQMTRAEPRLAGTPFRVLLDFERATDAAFILPRGPACQTSPDAAHTGQASLKLVGPGTVDVKLASLLSGTPFPGTWTLAGGYFRPATAASAGAATRITLAYRLPSAEQPVAQRTIDLSDPERWSPVFLDLTSLAAAGSAEVGQLTIQVEGGAAYCDDILLVNNATTFEAPPPDSTPGVGWTIKQAGYDILVERFGRFRVTLKTPEAQADGWTVEEANDLRTRLASVGGQHWTIYLDGRQYRDATFSSLLPGPGNALEYFAQQHASPAEPIVPDEFGRIDRDTPGDRNNDGYNERRGSYQLVAKGTRFEVLLRPHATPLVRPVLEISGLAPGEALVTVEGQLIEKSTRLANNNLLVELPIALRRPTTVNVTVR